MVEGGTKKKREPVKITSMTIRGRPLRKDVIGQAGKFIDEFIQAVDSKEIYDSMGVSTDKSFLITGSPGNGKSLTVDALVNQINHEQYLEYLRDRTDANLTRIKTLGFKYDIGRYGTAYINEGAKTVQRFFDTCFKVADLGYNSIVIFDEADVLFGKRTQLSSHKEDTKVLETIMKNMQVLHDRENIYLIMMSNFPEAFDDASIRSGRVDKKYEFKNPTEEERIFAYDHAIGVINNKATHRVIRRYNTEHLASITEGFSYSDIIESVNAAVKRKAREISLGRAAKTGWITQKKLVDSINNHREHFVAGKNNRRIGF